MLQKLPLYKRIFFAQCDGIIDIPSLAAIPSVVDLFCDGAPTPPAGTGFWVDDIGNTFEDDTGALFVFTLPT